MAERWETIHDELLQDGEGLDEACQRIAELEERNKEQQTWIDTAVASCAKKRCSERERDVATLEATNAALVEALEKIEGGWTPTKFKDEDDLTLEELETMVTELQEIARAALKQAKETP